jgi:ATP-dependent helicase/nuclease subunit B
VLPAHYTMDDPVVYIGEEKGKSANFRWHNLQLPLYALGVMQREKILATPCYFSLGSTESEVAVHEWTGFETADLEAAKACADWVAERIAAKAFWPPAEKVMYDDYQILAAGRTLEEMIKR